MMYVAEQGSVQSVERTFKLIEILSKKKEMSIKDMSDKSGLHKATVHRLINTLVSLGYVSKNEQNEHYALSPKLLRVSSRFLEHFDIREQVRPLLEKLSKDCGETVHLVERNGKNVVYIDKFEAPKSSIRMVSRIGMSQPMPITAVGKAILAELEEDEIFSVWEKCTINKRTENTITDYDKLMKEIEKIRAVGYAVDNEENEIGVFCIAATLPKVGDNPAYAFSISAPIQRADEETVKKNIGHLLEAKAKICEVL